MNEPLLSRRSSLRGLKTENSEVLPMTFNLLTDLGAGDDDLPRSWHK